MPTASSLCRALAAADDPARVRHGAGRPRARARREAAAREGPDRVRRPAGRAGGHPCRAAHAVSAALAGALAGWRRSSRLVFIVRDLEPDEILRHFARAIRRTSLLGKEKPDARSDRHRRDLRPAERNPGGRHRRQGRTHRPDRRAGLAGGSRAHGRRNRPAGDPGRHRSAHPLLDAGARAGPARRADRSAVARSARRRCTAAPRP